MTDQATDKPVILVVDDSKVIRKAAAKMLGSDYIVLEAVDGSDAWTLIQQDARISVIFSDLQMPEMNGLELLELIRSSDDDRILNLPVIMITGQGDTEAAKREVFEHGATDFISKPFESIDLVSRAKSYAKLTRKVVELEKQTGTDKLTGLANMSSFEEQGTKALSFAQRHKLHISIVQLEIEAFQELFLTHGKNIAQQILVAVGKKLSESLRAEDIPARIGVAKYALLLPLTNPSTAMIVVNRIRDMVNKLVFDTGKEKIRVGLVAGITSPDASDELVFDDLMQQSDQALAQALQKTDLKIATFSDEPEVVAPQVTEEDMRVAFARLLEGNYYQIPDEHLRMVVDRIKPFLEYVDNQNTPKLTGTDGSA